MSAMESLCKTLGINPRCLSKEENLILEAELYYQITSEIITNFQNLHRDYFRILNNIEREQDMGDLNVFRSLINDLLKNDCYTLPGIASYTQTPEEILHDLIIKNNDSPILFLTRKVIELHRTTYPDLYKNVLNKILCNQTKLELNVS